MGTKFFVLPILRDQASTSQDPEENLPLKQGTQKDTFAFAASCAEVKLWFAVVGIQIGG